MDRIRIVGGNKLNGIIPISGAKKAALLTEETLILDNVPRLADVAQLQRVCHLDRGFERLEDMLKARGASIERVSD